MVPQNGATCPKSADVTAKNSTRKNLLLTQHFRMGLDGYKHKRNLNVLVVGGSGAGKSRTYAIPNIMQCNCSMVITDPKAELCVKPEVSWNGMDMKSGFLI